MSIWQVFISTILLVVLVGAVTTIKTIASKDIIHTAVITSYYTNWNVLTGVLLGS